MNIKEYIGNIRGSVKIVINWPSGDEVYWRGSNLIVKSYREIMLNHLMSIPTTLKLTQMRFGTGVTPATIEDLALENVVGGSNSITKTLFNPPGHPNYNTGVNCRYIIPAVSATYDGVTISEAGLFNSIVSIMFARSVFPGVLKVVTVPITFDWELYF